MKYGIISYSFLLSFAVLLQGCTFPFDPSIEGSQGTLVIQGRVINQEGYQYIEVSRSILLSRPEKTFPIKGCTASIQDELGHVFPAEEKQPGLYACWIPAEYLGTGSRFQAVVMTPNSRNYVSDYAEILDCPPIDSISWEIEEIPTSNPDVSYQGVRFYITSNATGEYAQNYRWELEETWEYHSYYTSWVYYDGEIRVPDSDSDSLYYCWNTRTIPEIYTYSTQYLTRGLIKKFPLTYVSNGSDRLTIKYSLLVRQYSLTKPAYEYWKILEEQSKKTGELYETQPAEITGNIHSVEDPKEYIMGMFYATSIQEQRIFIDPNLPPPASSCERYGLLPGELNEWLSNLPEGDYPVRLVYLNDGMYDFAKQECFDCTLKGGSTIKPDFWE